jgi:hypothetical protein
VSYYIRGIKMKKIKEYLEYKRAENIAKTSKDCLSFDELCSYAEGALPTQERGKIERHLAECYRCLDILVSIHDGTKKIAKTRRVILKKEHMFLAVAIIAFTLSFIFSRYFLQFLTATIVFGIKWIVDSKSTKTLIMINEAWKRGGEVEAMRVLKDIKTGGGKNTERFL